MGLGDVLMSIGEAKRVHQRTQQPVLITDAAGRPVRSDLFTGVPYLLTRAMRNVRFQRLVNCPGHRPYIKAKAATHWTWRDYQPEPADIVLTERELIDTDRYRGCVMIEPNVKEIGHRNKDWGWGNWLKLATLLEAEGIPVVQCHRSGDRLLPYGQQRLTAGFRETLAVLSKCRAYVGPEGGLHHGAAAMRVPAVVIFGEFISPNQTGYRNHANLFAAHAPCGNRTDCPTCRAAMSRIYPEEVVTQVRSLLESGTVARTPNLFELRGERPGAHPQVD